MSYPYLLLICTIMMVCISCVMYFLGTKISYNYILYNASVSIGSGVIFFIVKMILTMEKVGPIEQILDIVFTLLLLTVWLVTLVETLTIEVMENGRQIKENLTSIVSWIKTIEMKEIPYKIVKRIKMIDIKAIPLNFVKKFQSILGQTKTVFAKNRFTLKIQKSIGELQKNRELNKRV